MAPKNSASALLRVTERCIFENQWKRQPWYARSRSSRARTMPLKSGARAPREHRAWFVAYVLVAAVTSSLPSMATHASNA